MRYRVIREDGHQAGFRFEDAAGNQVFHARGSSQADLVLRDSDGVALAELSRKPTAQPQAREIRGPRGAIIATVRRDPKGWRTQFEVVVAGGTTLTAAPQDLRGRAVDVRAGDSKPFCRIERRGFRSGFEVETAPEADQVLAVCVALCVRLMTEEGPTAPSMALGR